MEENETWSYELNPFVIKNIIGTTRETETEPEN